MADLLFQSAASCAALIRKKELSPVELMRAVLAHVDAVNPALDNDSSLQIAEIVQPLLK